MCSSTTVHLNHVHERSAQIVVSWRASNTPDSLLPCTWTICVVGLWLSPSKAVLSWSTTISSQTRTCAETSCPMTSVVRRHTTRLLLLHWSPGRTQQNRDPRRSPFKYPSYMPWGEVSTAYNLHAKYQCQENCQNTTRHLKSAPQTV